MLKRALQVAAMLLASVRLHRRRLAGVRVGDRMWGWPLFQCTGQWKSCDTTSVHVDHDRYVGDRSHADPLASQPRGFHPEQQ